MSFDITTSISLRCSYLKTFPYCVVDLNCSDERSPWNMFPVSLDYVLHLLFCLARRFLLVSLGDPSHPTGTIKAQIRYVFSKKRERRKRSWKSGRRKQLLFQQMSFFQPLTISPVSPSSPFSPRGPARPCNRNHRTKFEFVSTLSNKKYD